MTYEDIRVPVQLQSQMNNYVERGNAGFFSNFLCGVKGAVQEEIGCKCVSSYNGGNGGNGNGRCPWMDHWLSLSMKTNQN